MRFTASVGRVTWRSALSVCSSLHGGLCLLWFRSVRLSFRLSIRVQLFARRFMEASHRSMFTSQSYECPHALATDSDRTELSRQWDWWDPSIRLHWEDIASQIAIVEQSSHSFIQRHILCCIESTGIGSERESVVEDQSCQSSRTLRMFEIFETDHRFQRTDRRAGIDYPWMDDPPRHFRRSNSSTGTSRRTITRFVRIRRETSCLYHSDFPF